MTNQKTMAKLSQRFVSVAGQMVPFLCFSRSRPKCANFVCICFLHGPNGAQDLNMIEEDPQAREKRRGVSIHALP